MEWRQFFVYRSQLYVQTLKTVLDHRSGPADLRVTRSGTKKSPAMLSKYRWQAHLNHADTP